MAKTAAELMAELSHDKSFDNIKQKKAEKIKSLENFFALDEKSIITELLGIGFEVKSVWDFVNSPNNYDEAIPVLIRHLDIYHHPRVLSGILRALAIPELSNNELLWRKVVEIFCSSKSDVEIEIPEERGLQEAAAIAIEALSISSRKKELKILISEKSKSDGAIYLKEKLKKI